MSPVFPDASRTCIKICGITREEDLEAAVAAGADAVGFVQYPKSPRFVPIARAAALARRLPASVTPVLLFVNADPSVVASHAATIPGAMLQFHGDESPLECLQAAQPGQHAYLRAARIPTGPSAPAFDLVKYADRYRSARAILLDAYVEGYGGGGKTFNWSLLPPSVDSRLVLSGGLTPANVIDGILQVRPRCTALAVDVSSGVEVSPGLKDAGLIHQFVAAVRAADRQLASSNHVPLPAA